MDLLDIKLQSMLCIPRVYQLGMVVRDIEKAMFFYTRFLCIGPWYRVAVKDRETLREGRRIDFELDMVFGYSGNLAVRLLCPGKGDPNIFGEHLARHGEGLHHLGFEIGDFDRQMHVIDDLGIPILQSTTVRLMSGAVSRCVFLDTTPLCGYPIALMETRLLGIACGKSRYMMKIARLLGDAVRLPAPALPA